MPRCVLAAAAICLLNSAAVADESPGPLDLFAFQPDVPAADRNPWPQEWEQAFRARWWAILEGDDHAVPPAPGYEGKRKGGAFAALIKGRREAALALLRSQPESAPHTAGIDFYWCFHLPHQIRTYFHFGRLQPAEFMQRMREGARLWTAEDPRPNLELVLHLNSSDADLVAHARRQLAAMWRDPEQVREMIAQAREESRGGRIANKERFAAYLEGVLPQWPTAMPEDRDGWYQWWALLAAGDWMIFEEYERRTNPRPHPLHGIGTGPVGHAWNPGVRGGWVDWRNTDNLRAKREVATYLFAQETGNELVRKVYAERIRRTATAFFGIGQGEWDSPTYLRLTAEAYMLLYDHARDREVRLLAKGIVDFLAARAAVKYFRAGAAGPNTRDYGTWRSGEGGGASRLLSTWLPDPRWAVPDELASPLFFSAYRPPAAVVALANGDTELPWELLASHPTYSNWLPGADERPAYHETQCRSRDFQMGSQVQGSTGDGNGCKIVLAHPQRGFDYLIPTTKQRGNPCVNPRRDDRVAQCRNALLWLNATRRDGSGRIEPTQWRLLLPADAQIERHGDVVLLRFASAWAALHPHNMTIGELDPRGAAVFLRGGEAELERTMAAGEPMPAVLMATGHATEQSGFALEVADGLHFEDYEAFKTATLERAQLREGGGRVAFAAASGAQVAMTWDGVADLPVVERDGRVHDWEQHRALSRSTGDGPAPVQLGWKEGRLVVEAGGHRFTGVMDLEKGIYRFVNETMP